MPHKNPTLRFRLLLDADHTIGPGKIDLLEAIAATGSIAAAGRTMNMSYKRAWQLVDNLNRSLAEPLVATSKGGTRGGGAVLTSTGDRVLAAWREIQCKAQCSLAPELRKFSRMLAK